MKPPWEGRRLYQYLSSAPILSLRNRLVLVLMRCQMGDFLFNDLYLDPEAQTLWSYTMAIRQFQQDIRL